MTITDDDDFTIPGTFGWYDQCADKSYYHNLTGKQCGMMTFTGRAAVRNGATTSSATTHMALVVPRFGQSFAPNLAANQRSVAWPW